MEAGIPTNGAGTANGLPGDSESGGGNEGLQEAFDAAIAEAQKTLETTTIRGADLYALKQNAR